MMTEQSKSVVEIAREVGLDFNNKGDSPNYPMNSNYWVAIESDLSRLCEAYAAQAIEQYKQELLKGVELPERRALPVKASGILGHALGYTKDQLHQTIAAAVLPLKAEVEQKGIEIMIGLTKQQDLALSCKTLQSRVTQLEQELAEALAYKQDAENPNEWLSWDGGYEKQSYDVWVKGCDVVVGCWPNAGFMSAVDGTGRKWKPTDVLAVRVSEYQGRFPKPLHAARAQEVKTLDESKESEQ